jgi:hypothetical protein
MREGRRGPSDLDRAVVRDECRASRRFRRVLVKGEECGHGSGLGKGRCVELTPVGRVLAEFGCGSDALGTIQCF